MRRLLLVFTAMAVMVAMMVATAVPAFAAKPAAKPQAKPTGGWYYPNDPYPTGPFATAKECHDAMKSDPLLPFVSNYKGHCHQA